MRKVYTQWLKLEVDFTEWAIPLEVWWTTDSLCFEILCFAITFTKALQNTQVIVDEL